MEPKYDDSFLRVYISKQARLYSSDAKIHNTINVNVVLTKEY